jgi:hypothetical protein
LFEMGTAVAAVIQFALVAAIYLPKGLLGALRNSHLGAGRALSVGVACALAAGFFAVLAIRRTRPQSETPTSVQ